MAQVLAATAWSDRLHYMSRARTFMGLAAETRLSAFNFNHFDDRLGYIGGPLALTIGTGGANRADPTNSCAYLLAAPDAGRATSSYTYWHDNGSGAIVHWPVSGSSAFYIGFRWKVLQTDVAVTFTDFTWESAAAPVADRIRVRPNGSGTMVVTISNDGVSFDTLGSYTQDTNYHVIEIYSNGTTSNCSIDGVAGTPSSRIPNAQMCGVTRCFSSTTTNSEVFVDWLAIARQ